MLTLLALFFFSSSALTQAQTQDAPLFSTEEGKYGEERARGDLVASSKRMEFELAVCRKSLKVFCPSIQVNELKTLNDCRNQQVACDAMETAVETRFISKYGKGSQSANEDALPAIQGFLKGFHDFQKESGYRNLYIQEIAHFTGSSTQKVTEGLLSFFSHYDSKRPPVLHVDFWGYFQQSKPQRPEFTYREDGTLGAITIAFRFCGTPLVFVRELHLTRDILAQAIFPEEQLPQLKNGESYSLSCDELERKHRQSPQ